MVTFPARQWIALIGVALSIHLVYFGLLISSAGSLVTKHTVAASLDKLKLDPLAAALTVPVLELAQTRLLPEPIAPFQPTIADRALATEDAEFPSHVRLPQAEQVLPEHTVVDISRLEQEAQEPFEYLRGDLLPAPGVPDLTPQGRPQQHRRKPSVKFRFHE